MYGDLAMATEKINHTKKEGETCPLEMGRECGEECLQVCKHSKRIEGFITQPKIEYLDTVICLYGER